MSLVHALEKDELLFKRLWFFLFVILSVKVIKILLMHYVNQLKAPIGLGAFSVPERPRHMFLSDPYSSLFEVEKTSVEF